MTLYHGKVPPQHACYVQWTLPVGRPGRSRGTTHLPVLPAGRPGRQSHLPDRFRLRRTGGSIPVEVFVQRHVDFGTWLLDARVSESVALGVLPRSSRVSGWGVVVGVTA